MLQIKSVKKIHQRRAEGIAVANLGCPQVNLTTLSKQQMHMIEETYSK